MKLIEAMKELRIIEKKIQRNCTDISRYSSIISTERPLFETEEKQRKEVNALVQSNKDLITRYIELKEKIEETNLKTKIELNGKTFSLSSLLIIKRKLGALMLTTFNSMDDKQAEKRLVPNRFGSQTGEKTPHVIRLYKEEDKNKELREWHDLLDNIDSRLEVVNAQTDLVVGDIKNGN